MAKMYWWKSLTVTYQFHNLFGGILFLIEAVNWISGSYEHNKSDFFSADLTTDRIPRHCTISPSSFTQPFLGSSFTSKFGDCLTAFSSAPSHQGWSQACPKGHQLVEGPQDSCDFLWFSPFSYFPFVLLVILLVLCMRGSPHQKTSQTFQQHETLVPLLFGRGFFFDVGEVSFRRAHLFSSPGFVPHKGQDFLPPPTRFLLLLSSFFCLKDGPLNLLLQHLDQVWMDRWMKKVAPLIFRYAPTGT